MPRKIIILTEGHTEPQRAKTASCMIRYCPDEVVAILDSTQAGKTSRDLLNVGDVPIVSSLDAAPAADTLLLGIAPAGGKIPPPWRAVILDAIHRGLNILGGLHDFVSDDPQFAAAARQRGVTITDVRKNNEKDVAQRIGLRADCLRIHTVGHDVSIGKMVASVELTRGLKRRGYDAKFIATGQTGCMVEGDGCTVDSVVADFVSGTIEKQILQHQQHDILVIEGQGSLVHPSYSGVTLGLLHGCSPHGLILCYEIGRQFVSGISGMRIPPLATFIELNEHLAAAVQPGCRVIGIAMNGRNVTPKAIDAERERIRDEFALPACDVIHHGANELVDAVIRLQEGSTR